VGKVFKNGRVSKLEAGSEAVSEHSVVAIFYHDGTKDIVLEEILKAEGLPYVRLKSLADLKDVKALILGEVSLTPSWVDALKAFVKEGGVLVALKPDGCLSRVFDVEDTGGMQRDGYITLKGDNPYAEVSYEGRFPIFGLSKLYAGGKMVVELSPSQGHGGIVKSELGKGAVHVVGYDVPTTFLTIQQPDAEVGRAYDIWRIEPALSHAPLLDLMRRLFVNLVVESIDYPLPRKWYFPHGRKALVLLSGDQDGADQKVMNAVKALVTRCAASYTLYATPRSQPLGGDEIRELREIGVEVAVHPDFTNLRYPFTEEEFKAQLLKTEGEAGVKVIGTRSHCLRWEKVLDIPMWMEKHGVQYDSDLGCRVPLDKPGLEAFKLGYYAGGGLPYFFIHPQSFRRIDALEEPIMVSDDILWMKPSRRIPVNDVPDKGATFLGGMGLSEEEAFQLAKTFMDDSLEKYYTAQCYIFHPAYLAMGTSANCFQRIVEYAKEKDVLLLTQGEWNTYWRGREEAHFTDLLWNTYDETLEFTVLGKRKVKDMTFIAPLTHQGGKVKVTINGKPTPYREEMMNKRGYAMFTSDIGVKETHITLRYS